MSFALKSVVVIKQPCDWDEWILIINAMAKRRDFENFVDLTAIETPESTKPETPSYVSIKEGARLAVDLSEDQRKDLLIMREDYKDILKIYKQKKSAPKDTEQRIMTIVNR